MKHSGPPTGRWLSRSALTKQFDGLVSVLGVPELARDERFSGNANRVANRSVLKSLLEERLQSKSAGQWAELLSAEGVPAGKVNTIMEALDLADQLGLAPVIEISDEKQSRVSLQVASSIHLSETPAQYRRLPPLLGEHNGASFDVRTRATPILPGSSPILPGKKTHD